MKYAFHQGGVAFGQSRHEDKIDGAAKGKIYSVGSLETHKKVLGPLLDYAKEHYDLKRLVDLKPKMVRSYLERMQQDGASVKTLQTIRTAVLMLEHCVVKAFGCANRVFFPRDFKINSFKPEDTTKIKRHSPVSADIMRAWLYQYKGIRAGLAIEVIRSCGLRSGEAATFKVGHIHLAGLSKKDLERLRPECKNEADYTFYKKIGEGPCLMLEGKESGTKGGRWRVVPVPLHLVGKLGPYIKNKSPDEKVFPVHQRTIERWEEAARTATGSDGKGCHGLRRTMCIEYLDTEVKNGQRIDEVIINCSRILGHSRQETLAWYIH